MKRHLRAVAIIIELTSRLMECTHFNLDYSQMPPVAQQYSLFCVTYQKFNSLRKVSKIVLQK